MSSDLAKDLHDSALLFLEESVKNALSANTGEETRWRFAILHLVTSVEHLLKALLAKKHPTFIRQNIDKPENSVSIEGAFDRLKDPDISGIEFSSKDRTGIASAVKLRNAIAHGSLIANSQAMAANYFSVFAFVREVLFLQFGDDLEELIGVENLRSLFAIERQAAEIQKRAVSQIDSLEDTWECPQCARDYMVKREDHYICLFCHEAAEPFECDRCGHNFPKSHMLYVSDLFDWDYEGGRKILRNSFGIDESDVCQDCYAEIRNEISEEMERQEDLYNEEHEYYLTRYQVENEDNQS